MNGITVSGLTCGYEGHPVLENVSFSVRENTLLCVLGPNGVGKSTMFKCILRLLTHYDGSILLNGIDSKTLAPKDLAKLVAYIPQSHIPSFNYSVLDMVTMGTSAQGSFFSSPGKKQRKAALDAIEMMGISHLTNRRYLHLSGGERQLVLVARAVAQQAKILIMDEPTSNLDYGNQIRVLDAVKQLSRKGYTIIQSTHNPDQAFLYADEVLALCRGAKNAYGKPKDLISEGMIQELYGVDVKLNSLYEDKIRICVPASALAS
jgi:iron complex transport system ATP-binding protein